MTEASIVAGVLKDYVDGQSDFYEASEPIELGELKALLGLTDHHGVQFLVTVRELRHPAAHLLTDEGLAKLRAAEDEADRHMLGGTQ